MSKGTLIILFVLAPCLARPVAGESATNHECFPRFPLVAPWLGADAAYSIPLPDGRSVWIFGDTLYGEKRVVTDKGPRMVRNSIGLSSCSQGKWNIEYVIRKDSQGTMRDFFRAQRPQTWYWALDGFFHGDALWVTLLCVRQASTPRPDAVGFETGGGDLAKVTGLTDDTQLSRLGYFSLDSNGVEVYRCAAVAVSGEFVYLFPL